MIIPLTEAELTILSRGWLTSLEERLIADLRTARCSLQSFRITNEELRARVGIIAGMRDRTRAQLVDALTRLEAVIALCDNAKVHYPTPEEIRAAATGGS